MREGGQQGEGEGGEEGSKMRAREGRRAEGEEDEEGTKMRAREGRRTVR